MNQDYINTVRLLLDIAPDIFASHHFAMKGGTAINLFVQDLPRLSVDIDVVFVDHTMQRQAALDTISAELQEAKSRVERRGYTAQLSKNGQGDEARMVVTSENAAVKVEVNFVFRGTVLPPEHKNLSAAAQDMFPVELSVPVLATAELYGSKLVAAMDRQHPRDIFDVQLMYERFQGLPSLFVDCFVAYLAGHNRPVHEVLFGSIKPLANTYHGEFHGMTINEVPLSQLEATQARLFQELPRALSPDHRRFLLSLVQAEPAWDAMPFEHLKELPAIRWKLMNLTNLKKNAERFEAQHALLSQGFAALDATPIQAAEAA